MAMAAFERARNFARSSGDECDAMNVAGIACTASLASDRPKRGAHRAHVAVQTATFTATSSVVLVSDRRTRAEEEHAVADLVLAAVAEACGLETQATSISADEP